MKKHRQNLEKKNLAAMRQAGKVVAEMHERTRAALCPGITTAELDRIARDVLEKRHARSNFLGYGGFPAVICTSPNSVVVHGIPGEYVLQEGDIIGIDCGAIVDGWHADAAYTAGVGTVTTHAQQLMDTTQQSLEAAVEVMREGNRIGDIGATVQRVVEQAGYSVVRDYVGHGIGRHMHESPEVPNFGREHSGLLLRNGMVLAVEPMVNAGGYATNVLDDEWTVVTTDGSLSAHFEHSIAITEDGPEILTA